MKIPCPQCGGEVQVRETTGFVGCPFCGTSLVLDITGVRPHLLYRPRHGRADLLPLLRRWCDLQGLPTPSSIPAPQLAYYPFWRYVALGGQRLVPAWPTLEARWNDVAAPEAEQVIYDPAATGTGRVVDPSVAEAAARARAFGEAAAAVAPGDLVHVPFYEVQAVMDGTSTRVSIEACSGRIYPDRVPLRPNARAASQAFGVGTAIFGFLGMFLEAILVPPGWLAMLVVGLTAVALYGLIVSSARRTAA